MDAITNKQTVNGLIFLFVIIDANVVQIKSATHRQLLKCMSKTVHYSNLLMCLKLTYTTTK